jgi:hypothetical protein
VNVIISIDPGVMSGWAEFRDGKLTELNTYSPRELVLGLEFAIREWVEPPHIVVIEESRMQTHIWQENARNCSRQKAMSIARDVGRLDGFCGIIQEICETYKVLLMQLSPKQKGKKLNDEEFKFYTGWQGRTNQHVRDAAMTGWRYRNAVPGVQKLPAKPQQQKRTRAV